MHKNIERKNKNGDRKKYERTTEVGEQSELLQVFFLVFFAFSVCLTEEQTQLSQFKSL